MIPCERDELYSEFQKHLSALSSPVRSSINPWTAGTLELTATDSTLTNLEGCF